MSADTLETIARAIQNRTRHGPALISGVGELTARDALAQAADRLLNIEDVTTTFVYGISEGTVYVSARARGADIDLGETLRDAFGQIGSAGGHADMAGAQLSLGLLDTVDAEDESLTDVVDSVMVDRFVEAFDSRTNRRVTGLYPDDGPDVFGEDVHDAPGGPDLSLGTGGEPTGDDPTAGDDSAEPDDAGDGVDGAVGGDDPGESDGATEEDDDRSS